jgi:hypothetical protein
MQRLEALDNEVFPIANAIQPVLVGCEFILIILADLLCAHAEKI